MKRHAVQKLALMGLLIALEIVVARFCAVSTPVVRITFSFLPISMIAMLYGPLAAAVGYAMGDFIGAILFPTGGQYFPGFTVTAFLAGAIYGLVLYKKPAAWLRAVAAAALVSELQMVLDTFWLSMITGKAIFALLPIRFMKSLLMIPVIACGIQLLSVRLLHLARRHVRTSGASAWERTL